MEFDKYSRAEVMERLFAGWNLRHETEIVPLEEAKGRISAETIRARFTLPLVRSSAVDGIAVRSAAFSSLPDTARWKTGEDYVRADTGDDFDDRFDAVIMIEDVVFNDKGGFTLSPDLKVLPGMNIHGRGSAVAEGEAILESGLVIRSCDLGALARGGIWGAPVVKKPVVSFIPTGNELIPVGKEPQRGENIDTNSIMVKHMLLDMGAEPRIFPIHRDDPPRLKASLLEALAVSDAVIINGGSSKGAEDYNARLLAELGDIVCHGVHAAPGRPVCIAVIDNKPAINVPGPMLASYFVMDWCVRGIVCRFLGIPMPVRPFVKAVLRGESPRRGLPDGFEFFSRMILTPVCGGPVNYEARPVPLERVPGMRTVGFHNGQYIFRGPRPAGPGDEIEVELLCGPEYAGSGK
jgi:molybdopterin molybdotransferase/putative molybdopterin biosynthesis protein